jgi:hypothetical protein
MNEYYENICNIRQPFFHKTTLKWDMRRLNGSIYLIRGNHDKIKDINKFRYLLADVFEYKEIKYRYNEKEYHIIKIFYNNEVIIYQYSNHLSSIEEVFIKNISNESIDIINLEEFYKNVQEIEIFYDKNFLKDNLNIILENFNSVNKTNIVVEDIEKNYDEIRNI